MGCRQLCRLWCFLWLFSGTKLDALEKSWSSSCVIMVRGLVPPPKKTSTSIPIPSLNYNLSQQNENAWLNPNFLSFKTLELSWSTCREGIILFLFYFYPYHLYGMKCAIASMHCQGISLIFRNILEESTFLAERQHVRCWLTHPSNCGINVRKGHD